MWYSSSTFSLRVNEPAVVNVGEGEKEGGEIKRAHLQNYYEEKIGGGMKMRDLGGDTRGKKKLKVSICSKERKT